MKLLEGQDPDQSERDANGKWRYRPWVENGKLNFYDAGNVPHTIAGVLDGMFYPSTAHAGKSVFIIHPVDDPEVTIEVTQQFIAEICEEYKIRTVPRYIVDPRNYVVPMPNFQLAKWVDQIWVCSCRRDGEEDNTHVGVMLCDDERQTGSQFP